MALQGTKGTVALRYCAVVILMAVTQLAGFWFHSGDVYQGVANVPLSEFPEDVDFVFVLTFAATVFGLKYLIYELAGYATALMIDMASIFSASKPIPDSGIAILAAVFQTPLVLIACAGAIAAIVLWKGLPPRTGAAAAP
ncbi:hypothetical protein [Arthrobacter sp. AL12]|uniref:hypothetical protein n=1 Tax=Arthrobacter sp. AL12 TaxID=3042241 RepID=UPI00249B94E5|nr:hypothetical protein [Arthrobacter sp. AL12]MDI3211960.1 hypothetical protein [Arthrobacter sp. AL12]